MHLQSIFFCTPNRIKNFYKAKSQVLVRKKSSFYLRKFRKMNYTEISAFFFFFTFHICVFVRKLSALLLKKSTFRHSFRNAINGKIPKLNELSRCNIVKAVSANVQEDLCFCRSFVSMNFNIVGTKDPS